MPGNANCRPPTPWPPCLLGKGQPASCSAWCRERHCSSRDECAGSVNESPFSYEFTLTPRKTYIAMVSRRVNLRTGNDDGGCCAQLLDMIIMLNLLPSTHADAIPAAQWRGSYCGIHRLAAPLCWAGSPWYTCSWRFPATAYSRYWPTHYSLPSARHSSGIMWHRSPAGKAPASKARSELPDSRCVDETLMFCPTATGRVYRSQLSSDMASATAR